MLKDKATIREEGYRQMAAIIEAFEHGQLDALPDWAAELVVSDFRPVGACVWHRVGNKLEEDAPDVFPMWLWRRACRFCERPLYTHSQGPNLSARWFTSTSCDLHKRGAKPCAANADARSIRADERRARFKAMRKGQLAKLAADPNRGAAFVAAMRAALDRGAHLTRAWGSPDYVLRHLDLPGGSNRVWHAVMNHLLDTGAIFQRRSETQAYNNRTGRPGLFLDP